ncbi:DNA repair protein RecN [Legionella spiritensis]|uniref:DNA repair protein RecN n=1 Tax=Legionella spiritensis TaxID=452 RepID=UPI000F710D02|nr:DNA repair protein RecN [Legionella spiritensis]VEG91451.1 DNA repair ATPase [Legionella spiritensis]
MLTALRIENFAIVKHLELDFAQGMTAFTGETGAGKSIMIDALMLALGGRGDASVIRHGEEKCDIVATFQISLQSEPALWLKEHDIGWEDGEIILRRVLYAEGRSKSFVNAQPIPLQKIKELSEMLVHIHGQHQHQTLLQHPTHRQQLDHYAEHGSLLQEIQTLYKACQKIRSELEDLQEQDKNQDRMALLAFQIDELQSLNIQEGDMQRLGEEHQLLHHAQDYLQHSHHIARTLNGDEDITVCGMLNQILHWLQQLPEEHPAIKTSKDLLNNALIQCEETLNELRGFSDQVHLDPERLQEVEERISELHQAARKYHKDVDQLPEHLRQLQLELQQLKDSEQRVSHLQQQYDQQLQTFEQTARKLSASRKQAAEKLSAEITAIIRKLGMPNGRVEIAMTPLDKMQPHGLDRVEYKVCTNPGTMPDALNKIASGGELSRISLAIQMITAQRGATPTLLFDEVDVGIGGATAALVGQLLRKLGERLQVFCVTHQPQVASSAHHHFVVEKYSEQEQTFSRIISLLEDDKINEIARMLGGLTITEQTRLHARELLAQSL